jgi:hypothetical protein
MGRNIAIKRYDSQPEGQPLDLFATGVRSPVVTELLRAPWISRASDLITAEDGADGARGAAGKRVERPVTVEWDGEKRCPTWFAIPGRRGRYEIEALVGFWVEERFWWDPAAHVSRRCFRVIAHTGALYDLAYDRLAEEWLLVGVGD